MIGIYARQSVDKKDSISIDGQIDICKREISGEEIKIYNDKGFSGSNTNRPSFKQMIFDIEQGEINKVVVYKLDRISRSLLDFSYLIEKFKKHNVTFVSCTEKFDTSSPIGNAMLSIIIVFAQLERETIQQRITDNYYQRGKKGLFLGGIAPYGFNKVKTKIDGINTSMLQIDQEKSEIIRRIFDLYTGIHTLSGIAKVLNNENIPAAMGGRWNSLMVSRILRNPANVKADSNVYMYFKSKGCIITNDYDGFIGENGCYLYGKRGKGNAKYSDLTGHVLSLAPHSGFIDPDIWLMAQEKLQNNKQIKNTGKSSYTWLSGIVKCGKCGHSAGIRVYRDYKYFFCTGKSNYRACKGIKGVYIEDIEKHIETELLKRIDKIDVNEIKKAPLNNEGAKLRLLEIENQINKLINGLSTSSKVTSQYINREIIKLHAEKQSLTQPPINGGISKAFEDILQKIKSWNGLSYKEKKLITKELITKVEITDDAIKIFWKF